MIEDDRLTLLIIGIGLRLGRVTYRCGNAYNERKK
jgi:hypothetical protein